MAKPKKMTDEQIAIAVDFETDRNESDESTKLSEQRSHAMSYYYGEPFGTEKKDQSQVVTREVLDTIEWIKPELMKLFTGSDDTVRFEPQGPDDVEAAQQETDYINYLFTRKNPGFKLMYNFITDGLLQKTGVMKVWWDKDKEIRREEYKGVTDIELQMLLSHADVELLEQSTYEKQVGMTMVQCHDVAVAVTGGDKGLKFDVIPPEEFIISADAKDIPSSPFVSHRRLMPISDIRAMGYDVDEEDTGLDFDSSVRWGEEYQARHSYDGTDSQIEEDTIVDSMREVWVDEAYIRIDANGDGIAELVKIFKSGSTVFDREEVTHAPFAAWSPVMISHKFVGLSMADLVMDLQRLHSQLWRNMLDNQYLTNNGRYVAVENQVNLGDLSISRPHSAIRIKAPGALQRLDVPQLGSSAFQMLEYVERQREKRTGVSERTQGLDPTALGPNTHTGAVNQVMTAAQQRIELIARVFGETGLVDTFRLAHAEVRMNATMPDTFRLRDQYVDVDPTQWRERNDMVAVVGLGNGSKDMEMSQLQGIVQQQIQISQTPGLQVMVTPQNVYNAMEDLVAVSKKSSAGRYFTNPSSQEGQAAAQQQQQEQQEQKQIQLQINQQKHQLAERDTAAREAKVQGANQKAMEDVKTDRMKLSQADEHHSDEVAMDAAKLQLEAELEAQQERGVELD